jgi:hypothetical protein
VVGPKGDWGRAATSKRVLVGKPIKNWAFVFPASFELDAKKFFLALQEHAPKLGIQVLMSYAFRVSETRLGDYLPIGLLFEAHYDFLIE